MRKQLDPPVLSHKLQLKRNPDAQSIICCLKEQLVL
jgi:hypothetical protein